MRADSFGARWRRPSPYLKLTFACPFTGPVWGRRCLSLIFSAHLFSLRLSIKPALSTEQTAAAEPESAQLSLAIHLFTGPLDPSHKMRPNCVIFVFYLVLGCCAAAARGAARYTVRLISLYMLLFGRGKISTSPGINTLADISCFCELRLVGHVHMDAPVRESWGGHKAVTWRCGERRSWRGRAQATAEMNREPWSVCKPLDLISPTCPCHSDSQPR